MIFELNQKEPELFSGDLLVYFIQETGEKGVPCSSKAVRRELKLAWKSGDFTGKKGQTFLFYPSVTAKHPAAYRVLAVGLGKLADVTDKNILREQIRLAAGTAVKQVTGRKIKSMMAVLPEKTGLDDQEVAECLTEGLILGSYRFDKYKSKKEGQDELTEIEAFSLQVGALNSKAAQKGMDLGKKAADAACRARDMANEPGNGWPPVKFAEFAQKLARKHKLFCEVIEKDAMEKLGMGGILGVNQGSALPPKLVILKYEGGKKTDPTLMLVGKGLTFDSGGISLKPGLGMEDMKYDMCGGAAVICTMQAIAQERPKGINVVALVPSTENLPASTALKPGDIITHYGGKTSEIINTDAEGRLILADALAYGIATYSPDAVIDLATLTGAVIIGLGNHRTGLLSTDDTLSEQILTAGDRAGEPLWRLPLGPEYSEQIKSQVADIKNTGGRGGGTITAAAYLQEFVGNTPWAHLDIAGTAWNFTEKSYIPKGPSGIAVRTLVDLVRHWQGKKKEG
ncbi:MAG: leucyl aminopeptidase [Candidatus Electrothrix aestuarii]|uniref:Probable cytosol aminopeptidase n=1 Tax=Candidatus Electrothrix aestuarii TaxID=3062594 RepID=A0AAU8LV27_9BACT|nr:leucyl aminopeptidase [Candidatus Electrothrix aestuarii]